MQKTLIIVLLVAVIVLAGVIVYQKLTPSESAPIVVNQPVVNQPAVNCLKEGEQGSYATQNMACCNGLKQITNNAPLGAGCDTVSGTIFVCTACGNGVCGTGENKCNCPADCKSVAVNWQSLISDIRKAIGSKFLDMNIYANQNITIDQTKDITGDGISEALVNAGTGGAATVGLILMRLENNKPVLANFRKSNGEIAPINFLAGGGGAGRYGATTEMLPNKNAIYTGAYMAYGNASSDYCRVEAYQWNAQTKIFNYSASLSSELQKTYCEGICNTWTNECNSITDGSVTECLNVLKYICP